MFKKPVETNQIMIEVVECGGRHCMLRSGLIGANPGAFASAASKLPGTECALVDKMELIDTTNGGLEDDNEFIKAIATRPTWDAYQKISQAHGGRRVARDAKAEKYVAAKVNFNSLKANVDKLDIANKQAIKTEAEKQQAAKDANTEHAKAVSAAVKAAKDA